MMIAVIVILSLVAITFAILFWRSLQEGMALNEYTQFLLLNPSVYEDHRAKFADYLRTTGGMTATKRATHSMATLSRAAKDGRSKLWLANVAARNAIAKNEAR